MAKLRDHGHARMADVVPAQFRVTSRVPCSSYSSGVVCKDQGQTCSNIANFRGLEAQLAGFFWSACLLRSTCLQGCRSSVMEDPANC